MYENKTCLYWVIIIFRKNGMCISHTHAHTYAHIRTHAYSAIVCVHSANHVLLSFVF